MRSLNPDRHIEDDEHRLVVEDPAAGRDIGWREGADGLTVLGEGDAPRRSDHAVGVPAGGERHRRQLFVVAAADFGTPRAVNGGVALHRLVDGLDDVDLPAGRPGVIVLPDEPERRQ
jgi:hypothetical protein